MQWPYRLGMVTMGDKTGSFLATAPLPWGGVERVVKCQREKKMNTSDNVISQPVELAGADLDSVSAGVANPTPRSPLKVLETEMGTWWRLSSPISAAESRKAD